jgi:hypothetical protein
MFHVAGKQQHKLLPRSELGIVLGPSTRSLQAVRAYVFASERVYVRHHFTILDRIPLDFKWKLKSLNSPSTIVDNMFYQSSSSKNTFHNNTTTSMSSTTTNPPITLYDIDDEDEPNLAEEGMLLPQDDITTHNNSNNNSSNKNILPSISNNTSQLHLDSSMFNNDNDNHNNIHSNNNNNNTLGVNTGDMDMLEVGNNNIDNEMIETTEIDPTLMMNGSDNSNTILELDSILDVGTTIDYDQPTIDSDNSATSLIPSSNAIDNNHDNATNIIPSPITVSGRPRRNVSDWRSGSAITKQYKTLYRISVSDGLSGPYALQSRQAIIDEVKNMLDYHVGTYINYKDIIKKNNIVNSFMFLKHKHKPNGDYDRTKARLVANGAKQRSYII